MNNKKSNIKTYGIWDIEWEDGRNYAKGQVATPHGFVLVYSEKGERSYTCLRFIWNGIEYYRGFAKSYSQPYLVTLARRYAEEIVIKSQQSNLETLWNQPKLNHELRN